METTKVYSDLVDAYRDPAVRVIALKGSTRSSKTWSALQLLDFIGRKSTKPRLISVVSESMPHLKRGAIRDFKNILNGDNVFNSNSWHDTDKTYSYSKGQIEFFSADEPGKVMGPARDVLYMNECINMEYEIFRQLAVRTTEKIILDYNPAYEFWVDSKILVRPDARLIHSTYLDNDMLSLAQIAEIESNREIDPDWWNVYGLGLTGSREGLVVQNWDIVAGLPPRSEWKEAYIGVDFGWDAPSAIMLVVLSQGEVWIDELGYGPGMDNPQIAQVIKDSGYAHLEVIADAAEPKSISEVKNEGLSITKSDNKDIKLGVRIMNRYKKHYTARSLNSIDENRKYRWPKNVHGEYDMNLKPVKKHGHAKDAERYVFLNRLSNISSGFDVTSSS